MESGSGEAAQVVWTPSVGVIRYGPGIRAVLVADQGISDFYRSLIPKSTPNSQQKHHAHISVVRHESPTNMSAWGKYEGELVWFEYSNVIANDEAYFWLPARCGRIQAIRQELGLAAYPWHRDQYHITIANVKSV